MWRHDRHEPCLFADRDRLRGPYARAVSALGREPIVVREIRAPFIGDTHNLRHLIVVA